MNNVFMELTQLKQFNIAAKHENISRAAEILNITPPALSKSIKNLEDELGVELFDRKGRKVVLNEYGKIVKKYSEYMFANMDFLYKEIHSMKSANRRNESVRVCTISDGVMWPIIPLFSNNSDDIKVLWNVVIAEKHEEGLLSDAYDVAFTPYKLKSKSIHSIPFTEIRTLISVPTDHPLATRKSVSYKDLKGYTMTWLDTTYQDPWRDSRKLNLLRSEVDLKCFNDMTVCNAFMKKSGCLGMISNFSIDDSFIDRRVLIPLNNGRGKQSLTLYISYIDRDNKSVREFVNFIINNQKSFNLYSRHQNNLVAMSQKD